MSSNSYSITSHREKISEKRKISLCLQYDLSHSPYQNFLCAKYNIDMFTSRIMSFFSLSLVSVCAPETSKIKLRWEGTFCKSLNWELQIKIQQNGFAEATPKRILQQMRVKGLRIAHIKSHLQVYTVHPCGLFFLIFQ